MDKTAKERMKRYRNKRRNETVTESPESVTSETEALRSDVTVYPAIVIAMADPEKRARLRRICKSLSDAGVCQEVRYGVSGVTMDVCAEYLTALR